VSGFLLPAQRRRDAIVNRRFLRRRTGGPRVFAVIFQRPPRKDMPLRQQEVLAVRRQLEAGEIFGGRTQARSDEDHPVRINAVDDLNGFLIHPVERGCVVVELVRRLINQVKAQQRRTFAEIVRHGNPPVGNLFFVIGFRIVFIAVRLIRDNRDHAVLLAGFHQLTQVDQPCFGRLIGHTNTHMADAFRAKVAYHQRVEFPYPALGARPVHVHTHTQLLCIKRSRQRRLGGYRPAGREK